MRGRKTMGPSTKDCQVPEEKTRFHIWSIFGLKMGFFLFGSASRQTPGGNFNHKGNKVLAVAGKTVLPARLKRPEFYQGRFGMAGKIRQMIDLIINQRAKDNPMLERVIKTKLMLKGINPKKYTLESPDDPAVIQKLERMVHMFR